MKKTENILEVIKHIPEIGLLFEKRELIEKLENELSNKIKL